jgi:hypothetical protein
MARRLVSGQLLEPMETTAQVRVELDRSRSSQVVVQSAQDRVDAAAAG